MLLTSYCSLATVLCEFHAKLLWVEEKINNVHLLSLTYSTGKKLEDSRATDKTLSWSILISVSDVLKSIAIEYVLQESACNSVFGSAVFYLIQYESLMFLITV
jgi:hypothetical protein